MGKASIDLPREEITEFCRKWKIREFALFGSVLRDDFNPHSDIDVLVSFGSDADWSLFDHIRMEEELGAILGHKVDMVTRRAIERSHNWIRRKAILESIVPYYVEG
jgi:predicted nucleotidyltransferase